MLDHAQSNTPATQTREDLSPVILLKDIDEQREQWLNLRRGKVSSSNVSVICGLNPYKSPLQLWAEWTGKLEDTFTGNKATQLGLTLEPLVAQWFCERNQVTATRANALFQDSEFDWLVASPDYILADNNPLEIKTGSPRTASKWAEGGAPYEYILQVQIQLRVLRRKRGFLTAYLGDFENMPDVAVEYDPELFALVQEKAEQFLDCVKQDIPPTAGAGDADLIRTITKREEGSVVVWSNQEAEAVTFLVAQAREAAETCSRIRKELEKVDKQKRELENRIKQTLGTSTVGRLPDGRVVQLNTVHVGEKLVPAYAYDRLTLPKN